SAAPAAPQSARPRKTARVAGRSIVLSVMTDLLQAGIRLVFVPGELATVGEPHLRRERQRPCRRRSHGAAGPNPADAGDCGCLARHGELPEAALVVNPR